MTFVQTSSLSIPAIVHQWSSGFGAGASPWQSGTPSLTWSSPTPTTPTSSTRPTPSGPPMQPLHRSLPSSISHLLLKMKLKSQQSKNHPAAETEEAEAKIIKTTKMVPDPTKVKVRVRVRAEAPDTPTCLPGRPARSTGSSGRPPGCVPTATTAPGGTSRTPGPATTEILPVLK